MSNYGRSVLLRAAGALAGTSIFFGLIVLALANFDTPIGVPGSIEATWPFWVLPVLVVVGVFLALRRAGPGPGWGAFTVGLITPFVALLIAGALRQQGGILFWVVIAVLVLVPMPTRGGGKAAA